MLPRDNLKFRSSKTAGNVPKTPILLILSLSAVYMAKIGSARTRSCQVLPYSADWQVRSSVSPLPDLTTPDLTR